MYYFDEFFVSPDDPGITYNIPIRGRLVPIVCKRGLTLRDKEEAQAEAITKHVDEETGRVVVDGIDDMRLNLAVLSRAIKSWPFVYRETGQSVPVTPENISLFLSEGADRLVEAIARGTSAQEEEATGPFGGGSAAASTTPDMATALSPQEVSPSA